MIPNNNDKLKGDVAWHGADHFYNLLHDIQFDIIDCQKQNDFNGLVASYDNLYIFVLPFIKKHMNDKDEDLFDLDYIYNLLSKQRKIITITDEEIMNNLKTEIMVEMRKKRIRLAFLMAKSGLYLPLTKTMSPFAAVRSDDEL